MILDKFLLFLVEYHYPQFNLFTKNKPDKIINKNRSLSDKHPT